MRCVRLILSGHSGLQSKIRSIPVWNAKISKATRPNEDFFKSRHANTRRDTLRFAAA